MTENIHDIPYGTFLKLKGDDRLWETLLPEGCPKGKLMVRHESYHKWIKIGDIASYYKEGWKVGNYVTIDYKGVEGVWKIIEITPPFQFEPYQQMLLTNRRGDRVSMPSNRLIEYKFKEK